MDNLLNLANSGDQGRFSLAFIANTERRYKSDEGKDERIRAVYTEGPRRGEIARLAGLFNWPEWAIKRRASELGLSRPRRWRPWSDAEQTVLEVHARRPPNVIRRKLLQAGFNRSVADISRELRSRQYAEAVGKYTLEGLASAFGVSPIVVRSWIRRGLLTAENRGTSRTGKQGGDIWDISEGNVRAFVKLHPMAFSLREVDQIWFLELITGGRICDHSDEAPRAPA